MIRKLFLALACLFVIVGVETNASGVDKSARVTEEVFHVTPMIAKVKSVTGIEY